MIFKVIKSSVDESRKSLGLFNKDWNMFKTNWQNAARTSVQNPVYPQDRNMTIALQGGGIKSGIASMFKSSDLNGLEYYNRLTQSGVSHMKAYQLALTGCSESVKQNAVAIARGTMSYEEAVASLKQMTAATRVAEFGMKALSIAANMLTFMAISKLITLAIEGIDYLVHFEEKQTEVFEKAKDAVKGYADSIRSIQDETKSMTDTIDEIGEAYAKLSQGVDSFTNKNINLSTSEYEEFLELNNQLADLFPGLTKGYDENGNAILGLGGNVDTVTDSIARLVEQQERLAKMEMKQTLEVYVDGDEENGGQLYVLEGLEKNLGKAEDALSDFKNKYNSLLNGEKVQEDLLNSSMVEDAKTFYKEAFGLTKEELEKSLSLDTNLFGDGVYRFDFSQLELDDVRKKQITESYESFYKQLNDNITYAKDELETSNKEMSAMMMMWVEDEFTYTEGNNAFQTMIQNMVNNVNWNALNIETFIDAKTWIKENIFDLINSIENEDKETITNALKGLFELDFSTGSLKNIKDKTDNYFKIIESILGKDNTNSIKIGLGFDKQYDLFEKYGNAIEHAANKFNDTNIEDMEHFFEQASINTQEELDNWLAIANTVDTATEAKENYLKTRTSFDMSSAIGAIDKYKGTVTSLATANEALTTVLSEQAAQNYITSESYDALIEANSAYTNCLEYGAGYMRINTEEAIKLAEAESEVALAELEVKEALEVAQYNENTKRIQELFDVTTNLTDAQSQELHALIDENKQIEENVRQYDLLESQLEQTLSGYNKFKQALSTPNQDDAYINIIEHLKTMQDLYDKNLIGYDEFKTGMSAYMGETANLDDFTTSMKALNGYFTEGQEGFNKFMNDLVKVGELQLNENGQITGTLDWESAKKSLAEYLGIVEITDEVMQALVGRGEAYGAVISTENGVDGVEDLTEAQNELTASIDRYNKAISEKMKLGLDTSSDEAKRDSLLKQLEVINQEIEELEATSTVKLDIDAELADLDLSNLSEAAQATLNQLNNTNAQIKIMAEAGLDTTFLEQQAQTQLNALKQQLSVPVEVNEEEAQTDLSELIKIGENFDTVVRTAHLSIQELSKDKFYDPGFGSATVKVDNFNTGLKNTKTLIDNLNNTTTTFTISTNTEGNTELNGTTGGFAHVLGTAFANGNGIGAKQSSFALTGEEGEELVVRGDRYFTVGKHGAEFAHIKKGDIVFNAEQTRQLLYGSGKIHSRGKAFASGTGFAYNEKNKSQIIYDTSRYKGSSNNGNGNGNNPNNTKDAFKEVFDWIERRIKYFQNKFDKWLKQAETALTSNFVEKYYKKASKQSANLMKTYDKAYERYIKEANKSGLDKKYKKLVQKGKIDIETIKDEKLAEKINEYTQWYDRAVEAANNFLTEAETFYNLPLEEAAIKIEKISDAIDLLDASLNNFKVTDFVGANQNLQEQIEEQYGNIEATNTAKNTAQNNLNSAATQLRKKKNLNSKSGVTDEEKKTIRQAIKNQQEVDLSLFKENSAGYNAAVKYNEALKANEKAIYDADMAQQEYLSTCRELEYQKFDNILTYYENQIDLLDASQQKIQDNIDLLETKGMTVGANYYKAQIAYEQEKINQYKESQAELEKQLAYMESQGLRGTKEWFDAVMALSEVDDGITECDKSIANMTNSITEVGNTIQQKILDRITSIKDEVGFVASLFSEDEMFDEFGGITESGLATLGSYVSEMNLSEYAAQQAGGLVAAMQAAMDKNELSFTYNGQPFEYLSEKQFKEAFEEANKTHQDYISAWKEAENQAIDMVIQKLEAEKSAWQDLIDLRKDALSAEKDLRDYQKSIKESTTDITSIEKQMEAIKGDTSEEGASRYQQLQAELESAKADLEDKEYDRTISDQQSMLDNMMEQYESLLSIEMKDRDRLLARAETTIAENANAIATKLETEMAKYDYSSVLGNIDVGILALGGGTSETNGESLSSIKTGIDNLTASGSLLETIKNTISNAVVQEGTIPTALTGISTSITNGLSGVSTAIANVVNAPKDNPEPDNNPAPPDFFDALLGSDNNGGYNPIQRQGIDLSDTITPTLEPEAFGTLVEGDKYSDAISKLKIPDGGFTPNNISNSDLNLIKDAMKKLGYNEIKSGNTWGAKFKNAIIDFKKNVMGDKDADGELIGNKFKKKLVKQLQLKGFSKGGIVTVKSLEDQIKANGDTVLGSLNPGEEVLTKFDSQSFRALVESDLVQRPDILNDLVQLNVPKVQPVNNQASNTINAEYHFTLENCNNASDLIKHIQNDRNVRSAIESVTINKINGGSRLSVNKYK